MKQIARGAWVFAAVGVAVWMAGCGWMPFHAARPSTSTQGSVNPDGGGTLRYYYFMEAQSQEKKGDLDKAIDFLQKAIELDSESGYLKRELALAYLKQNNTARAKELISALLDTQARDVESLVLLGRIHIAEKEYAKAAEVYEKVLAIDPTAENIFYFLGNYYLEKNDIDNAERIYTQLVTQKPDAYVGHFYLGRILLKKGDPAGAEEKLLYTIELAPDLEAPRKELIDLYEATGQQTKAIAMYQEMWDQNPDDLKIAAPLALLYDKLGMEAERDAVLADVASQIQSDDAFVSVIVNDYLEKERYPEALVLVDGMLKGASENATLQYLGGMVHDKLKNFKTAIDYFKRIPPTSKFYKSGVVHIAFLYQELGMTETAVGFLEDQLTVSPEVADFWLYYGTLLEEQDRLEAAVSAIRRGLERDPKHAGLHFRLGTILDKQGDKEGCIEQMRIVISIDPENANAINYLGYTFADLGVRLDEAERLIQQAIQLKPDDGYIIDSLGWVYFKQGRYPEAIEQLEKALKLVPEDPVILEHLGDAFQKTGNLEKAVDCYRRSLKGQNPPSEKLVEKLRFLAPEALP